mgnify:CR=1 FL=1
MSKIQVYAQKLLTIVLFQELRLTWKWENYADYFNNLYVVDISEQTELHAQ